MGARIRGLITVLVVLAAGVFMGSAISQWKPLPAQEGPRLDMAARMAQLSRNLNVAELGRVRVQVLNAGGKAGMAREVTEYLRDLGFDVVDWGNAESFDRDSTVVLDRADWFEAADAVARALAASAVRLEPDPNLYVDVTVLLGESWSPPLADADVQPDSVRRPRWWDLGRFFR